MYLLTYLHTRKVTNSPTHQAHALSISNSHSNSALFAISVCSGVTVKNLTVPQTYVLDHNTVGAPKPLILDCEYESDQKDTGIVLKWFFNNFPIYQWIPSSHPIPLQKFKPHLDTKYAASQDPKQMFRALSIQNPTWNMTGNYTCSLQSFKSSDQQSAELIVIGKSCRPVPSVMSGSVL